MNREEIDVSLSKEKIIDVLSADGHKIFVYCNRAGDQPSDKAIVIGHGLAGSPNSYMHIMARDYFNDRGYDVYRMAFYWDEPDYRKLHECTLDIQAQDLNSVIDCVRKDHEKIFVCGHSYGGLTLVFANPTVNALSFWDSSYQPWNRFWSKSITPSGDGNSYLLDWEYLITIGKPMIEEAKALTRDAARVKTERISVPSQVVVASESFIKKDTEMLFSDLKCPKETVLIKGAGHTFVEGKIVFELLDKTYQWFERF
ncbi:MAG: alpha/beta hydrolase [Alphaproteobacteria bacterium]|nr:alpha/beta hydrolase [Alphaproteobacteria bacterium]